LFVLPFLFVQPFRRIIVLSSFRHVGYASPKASSLDTFRWSLTLTGKKFTVKSYFLHLSSSLGNSSSSLSDCGFPCNIIWKSRFPLKVSFFVWQTCQGKILTLDNLQKRGKILVNICFMWKDGLETIGHLLLHCQIARNLRDLAFSCLGLHWLCQVLWDISYRCVKVLFFGRRAKYKFFPAIHNAIFLVIVEGERYEAFNRDEISLEWLKDKWLRTLIALGVGSFLFLLVWSYWFYG